MQVNKLAPKLRKAKGRLLYDKPRSERLKKGGLNVFCDLGYAIPV